MFVALKKYFVVSILACTYISCYHEEMPYEKYLPTVKIVEPADGEELVSGDELHLEMNFEYPDDTIVHVGACVINTEANDTVFYYKASVNTYGSYTLHDHYVTEVSDTAFYKVVAFTTNLDESDTVYAYVNVSVIPE